MIGCTNDYEKLKLIFEKFQTKKKMLKNQMESMKEKIEIILEEHCILQKYKQKYISSILKKIEPDKFKKNFQTFSLPENLGRKIIEIFLKNLSNKNYLKILFNNEKILSIFFNSFLFSPFEILKSEKNIENTLLYELTMAIMILNDSNNFNHLSFILRKCILKEFFTFLHLQNLVKEIYLLFLEIEIKNEEFLNTSDFLHVKNIDINNQTKQEVEKDFNFFKKKSNEKVVIKKEKIKFFNSEINSKKEKKNIFSSEKKLFNFFLKYLSKHVKFSGLEIFMKVVSKLKKDMKENLREKLFYELILNTIIFIETHIDLLTDGYSYKYHKKFEKEKLIKLLKKLKLGYYDFFQENINISNYFHFSENCSYVFEESFFYLINCADLRYLMIFFIKELGEEKLNEDLKNLEIEKISDESFITLKCFQNEFEEKLNDMKLNHFKVYLNEKIDLFSFFLKNNILLHIDRNIFEEYFYKFKNEMFLLDLKITKNLKIFQKVGFLKLNFEKKFFKYITNRRIAIICKNIQKVLYKRNFDFYLILLFEKIFYCPSRKFSYDQEKVSKKQLNNLSKKIDIFKTEKEIDKKNSIKNENFKLPKKRRNTESNYEKEDPEDNTDEINKETTEESYLLKEIYFFKIKEIKNYKEKNEEYIEMKIKCDYFSDFLGSLKKYQIWKDAIKYPLISEKIALFFEDILLEFETIVKSITPDFLEIYFDNLKFNLIIRNFIYAEMFQNFVFDKGFQNVVNFPSLEEFSWTFPDDNYFLVKEQYQINEDSFFDHFQNLKIFSVFLNKTFNWIFACLKNSCKVTVISKKNIYTVFLFLMIYFEKKEFIFIAFLFKISPSFQNDKNINDFCQCIDLLTTFFDIF